ncbi:hypothetical protein EVG20_g10893 [Dentipellis fragilis]|uniref:Uncharacterized protein n=1 Tax=Dentipellis fragilis TaxID=205917 RepID=A0A4Y9XPH7_9AGAM|nr:hypothetical protein EVG20_g10893 [Dentipellis fragilis]
MDGGGRGGERRPYRLYVVQHVPDIDANINGVKLTIGLDFGPRGVANTSAFSTESLWRTCAESCGGEDDIEDAMELVVDGQSQASNRRNRRSGGSLQAMPA